jgi:hypothetical protein
MSEYIKTKELRFPGMVARIYQPVLTPEEKSRRMQQIQKAAAALLTERK